MFLLRVRKDGGNDFLWEREKIRMEKNTESQNMNKYPVGRTFTENMSFSDSITKNVSGQKIKGLKDQLIRGKTKTCHRESGVNLLYLLTFTNFFVLSKLHF